MSLGGLVTASLPEDSQEAVKPTPEQISFFETKIRPVLVNSCYGCHGGNAHSSGLMLDTAAGLLKGGDSGSAVIPGSPEKSLLIHAINQTGNLKMPPDGKKLTEAQIADFEAWVKMGAPWPDTAEAKKSARESWWSLEPVKAPIVPKVRSVGWVCNPIDAFVISKLEARKISPAAPADKRTLIRRVTYDLTGLPPTSGEVERFIADKAPNAYDKVVDRLLASPRYGERWARHWMDVARYADTKGYVFQEDRNYYNAYTYRDWLVNAFNKDLPYDQFVTQQLAADRLPEVQNGDDKRPLAALGYLTLGRRFIGSVPDIIDDRIDVTMRGFEGLTVGCARCHDHKFDPIPTQDYYSLYAIFDSSQEIAAPISEKSITEPWERFNKRVSDAEAAIKSVVTSQMKRLRALSKDPDQEKSLNSDVKQVLQSLREDQVPDAAQLKKVLPSFQAVERDGIEGQQKALEELKKAAPVTPEFAMAMQDKSKCGDGVIFKRGNPGNRGDVAPRRFLLALSKPGEDRPHWTNGSGRLELAQAITSKNNPLTARVFVNRVWQDHFGAGIVRTPSDYGHQGDRPTDPALLDYLAWTFMRDGWSIKKLQRLIVTSATYRQSSAVSAQTFNADPDNRLWSRMNRHRLDLEEMRDTFVDESGQMDIRQIGGKSFDLWARPFNPRRALYGFIERQNLPGIFRTFDFASPDSTSARRFQTTVPQQSLFFMNSAFTIDQTKALAERPEVKTAKDDAQCVRRLYLLLFQRLPDQDEMSAALAYLRPSREALVDSPQSVWKYGYGGFDQTTKRATFFTSLDFFSDNGYRVGKEFPDPTLGYLVLNNVGGHPGHDGNHAAIRRWMAPADLTLRISGLLAHRQKEGDGVRARVISSRYGLLGEWLAHNSEAKTDVIPVTVLKGDTLDFAVDPLTNDGFDSFQWTPVIKTLDGRQTWDSAQNYGPPPDPPLTRLELFAQALMMTNEFMFVD